MGVIFNFSEESSSQGRGREECLQPNNNNFVTIDLIKC